MSGRETSEAIRGIPLLIDLVIWVRAALENKLGDAFDVVEEAVSQ